MEISKRRKLTTDGIGKIIWIAIGCASLFWVLESAVHTFVFHNGTFIMQIFTLNPHEIWMRLLVACIIIMFGIYAQFILTKRKQANEEIKALKQQIEFILGATKTGLGIIDSEFNIRYVDPEWQKVYGDPTGRKCYEYYRNQSEVCPDCGIVKALETKALHVTEQVLVKEGNRPVQVTTIPFQNNEGEWLVAEVNVDITERKQLEDEKRKLKACLNQSQKLEAVGMLACGIAHDFNNILAGIMGYTEMALYQLPKGIEAHEFLHQVLHAADRAKELVKQILTFSLQSQHEPKPVQIALIIKEALKLLRASLPLTIELRQNIEALSGTVLADPTRIHQVLMNLCANAAHAMREKGGVLKVSLAEVDIDADTAARHPHLKVGPYLRLSVSDTGHGMAHETIDRIFSPYFTTKGEGEGTGLGLDVVHGIVKDHNGVITVYSEPGKGTTFQIFLPRIKTRIKPRAETAVSLPRGHECILFVDDEEHLADMWWRMLEHLGYEVVAKTSGIEALEIFRSRPDKFDLVITDQTMPKMTGVDLTNELLRIRPDISIILCTGFSDVITAEQAKAMGIREFVMKPMAMREMAETIRRVIEKGL